MLIAYYSFEVTEPELNYKMDKSTSGKRVVLCDFKYKGKYGPMMITKGLP